VPNGAGFALEASNRGYETPTDQMTYYSPWGAVVTDTTGDLLFAVNWTGGYDPYLTSETKSLLQGWVELCEMERLFKESDIISIHIPLLPSTQKLIGAREFGWMKKRGLPD
jgi:hypothetical protein